MSHVAQIDVVIQDLDVLEAACRRIGLELVRGQETYQTYYTREDRAQRWERYKREHPDSAAAVVPEGFTVDELGKCQHAIRIPGQINAHEIGIVRRRDGKPGFALLADSDDLRLNSMAGRGCLHLVQAYAIEAARQQAQRQGLRVTGERRLENGSVQLVLSR